MLSSSCLYQQFQAYAKVIARKHVNILYCSSLLVKIVCFLIVSSLISFATGQLIVSGLNKFYLPSVEIFPPPPSNTCSIPDLPEGRTRHSLSHLSEGRLIVCGGLSWSSNTEISCIVWTPESLSWTHMHTLRSSYHIFSVHY